jgi:hypothetical protein
VSTGPQAAPELPGYTFRKVLGHGGFADVFLFEQNRARRDVAVKVLRERADQRERAQITAEAEVMAQLSTHPYIVSVYDADVAPDGRPYLVMEYYPRANLARRARSGGLDVPEVLRIGVQVASAVETAHRAGVVHRDIKPANILTSDYGRPGLTDFGIASRTGVDAGEHGRGMTVPWAAPELFHEGVAGDRRADVYALGATLWTLLVGRSPFETSDGDNSEIAMWSRIENEPVPPTGRADVPGSLERILRQSMAKEPRQRFRTALELARALQSVQAELCLAVEPVALPDLHLTASQPLPVVPPTSAGHDCRETQPRPCRATPTPPASPGARPAAADGEPGAVPDPADGAPDAAEVTADAGQRWTRTLPLAALTSSRLLPTVAAALSGIALLLAAWAAQQVGTTGATGATDQTPQDLVVQVLPQPSGTATRLDCTTVRFTWSIPADWKVSGYLVTRSDPGAGERPLGQFVTTTSFDLSGLTPDVRPCLDVKSADEQGATSTARRICETSSKNETARTR